MNIFKYDNTFEGFLSAVFYAYDTKILPDKIVGNNLFQEDLFAEEFTIYTNKEYAIRIWNGIKKKTSKQICQKIYRVFLSEIIDIEMLIYKYIKLTFNSVSDIDTNYSNNTVLEFNKIYKKVTMEAHRAVMFIRFQKTADGIYYAPFAPAYNVLPLTLNHFKDRFSDQQWVIYDSKRNYGFYYNLKDVDEIRINDSTVNPFTGKVNKEILDKSELNFQEIWNDYYQSTTIKERKNLKVHRQFLPKRFWKYLPEKNFLP
jgi:probable DNA metabolism protein